MGAPVARAPGMSIARIETLADGGFTIAMSLLALDLTVPEVLPTDDLAAVLPNRTTASIVLYALLPPF